MVATNHDWCLQLTLAHHFVEAKPKAMTLAVSQPTNTRWQTLERNALFGQAHPLVQAIVIGEFLEHCFVGCCNVFRVSRKRNPTEWPATFTEQRTNVCRQETWVVECAVVTTKLCFAA